jgi:hypothetical protein
VSRTITTTLQDAQKAPPWRPRIRLTVDGQVITQVLTYRLREWGWAGQGEVIIELRNDDGAFDHAGVAGTYANLRRGTNITLAEGLLTSAGTEYVQTGTYRIEETRHTTLADKRELFQIRARTQLARIEQFVSDDLVVWGSQTLDAVLTDLIQTRAGVIYQRDSTASFWTDHTLTLQMLPGVSAAGVLAGLIGPDGYRRGYVRFDASGRLRLLTLASNPISAAAYGGPGQHPIVAGVYGSSITPNRCKVYGRAVATPSPAVVYDGGFSGQADNTTRQSQHGLYLWRRVDSKLQTAARAAARAAEQLLDFDEGARSAWLVLPPDLRIELWDAVTITDGPVAGETMRVVEIERRYEAGANRWLMRLGLRGTV